MSDNQNKMNNKGFIALTIVLSIAGILLALVFASSIESALFFDQTMRKEYRAMNYYYAYDCLDQAILMLAHDYFFTVQAPLEIPEYHCTILSMESGYGGGNGVESEIRTISVRGNFQKAYVYRSATVRIRIHNLEVIKIE